MQLRSLGRNFLVFLAVFMLVWFLDERPTMQVNQQPKTTTAIIGTSLSPSHVNWLKDAKGGAAPITVLDEIIADLPVRYLRVSLQWDALEAKDGGWRFDEIDQILNRCETSEVRVILCIGLKNLTWPEFHLPERYYQKYLKGKRVLDKTVDPAFTELLYNYLAACLDRYGEDDRVAMIQVENEPLEPTGKDATLRIDLDYLREELDFVRSKTEKPILLTMGAGMAEPYLMARFQRPRMVEDLISLKPDQIGFNIYQHGKINIGPLPYTFTATPRHWLLARNLVDRVKAANIQPIVTELQFEPWEADPGKMDMKDPNGNSTFVPDQLDDVWERAQQLGCAAIYPWGLDFQSACKHQKNPAWWQRSEKLLWSELRRSQ